jgi:hypothetical protein
MRRWLAILLASFCLVVAEVASAQTIPAPPATKPTAANEAAAKKDFASGLKLYGEGAYAEALVAFNESYRLGGRPSALKNIAQCHRNLKHFVDAYVAYEQIIALHAAELSPPDKQAVQQALEELGVLTGTLVVTSSEPGAEITIDDHSLGPGPMAKPLRVSVAAHTVRVTKAGFDPFEAQVNVGSQEAKKVDVKLNPENVAAHVSIRESAGRDVHIFIDDRDEGPAPWEGEVPPGDHTVEAKGPRFASEARKLHFDKKERLDVALDATPLTGHLRLTTIPSSATIRVDGTLVGTGAWEGDVAEGTHKVEVGVEGQPPQRRDVVVTRGQLLVQEVPVAGALDAHVTEYRGLYVRATVAAAFAASGIASNAPVPSSSMGLAVDGRVDSSFLFQPSVAVRVGWSFFDWLGAEGVVIGAFEHREQKIDATITTNPGTPNSSTNDVQLRDQSDAINFFIGAGPRVTSRGEFVRFTFGLAPGVAVRSFNPHRELNTNTNGPSPNVNNPSRFVNIPTGSGPQSQSSGENFNGLGYTAFALSMDGGVLLGSTPGVKFYLGVQAWLDFPPGALVTGPDTQSPLPTASFTRPGRGITVIDGAQVYIGPALGLQFGH